MKTTLTESAWAATRKKGSFYKAKYESMVARRGNKKALLAIGHKILCAAYHILNDKEPFKELGGEFLEERRKKNRIANLTKELGVMGYTVEKVKEPVKGKEVNEVKEVKQTKQKVA